MSSLLVGLVFAPFVAWYAYRAIRAVRTGVVDLLGDPVTRADDPEQFWRVVARQILWAMVVATAGCLAVLGIRGPSLFWALGGYVVVYVSLHAAVTFFVRRSRRVS